jgi:glycerol dehydrogenase-like iron-containing ADH family enzyme
VQENGGGPLAAVFAAPGRYVQGRGAIARLGGVLEQLGSERPLILGDPIVEEIMGDALKSVSGATRVKVVVDITAPIVSDSMAVDRDDQAYQRRISSGVRRRYS